MKGEKEIHRPEIESSDMEIDGIHIIKNPKLYQDKGAITESDDDCMIVDSVPDSVTLVQTFKVEHLPSAIVLKGYKGAAAPFFIGIGG